MEKKYFTDKSLLYVSVLIGLSLVVCMILPFIDTVTSSMDKVDFILMLMIAMSMLTGVMVWYVKSLLYYPVFGKDRVCLRHAFFDRISIEVCFADIHYARVVRQVSGNGGESLRLFIEMKNGQQISKTIMTSVSQQEELASEFALRGIADSPSEIRNHSGREVFRSTALLIFWVCFCLFMFGMFLFCVSVSGQSRNEVLVIFLSLFLAGIGVAALVLSNYVVLDGNVVEIRNLYFTFLNVRCFVSDIESARINEQYFFKVVLKDSGRDGRNKKYRRYVSITPKQVDALSARLDYLLKRD